MSNDYEIWTDKKTGLYCAYEKNETRILIQIPENCILVKKTISEIVKEFPNLNPNNNLVSIVNVRNIWAALIFSPPKDEDLSCIKDFCTKIAQEIKKLMIN